MDLRPNSEHILATMRHAIHMHLGLLKHLDLPEMPDTNVKTEMRLQIFIEKVSIEDPRDPEHFQLSFSIRSAT